MRITGQLIEADTGAPFWADRFEGMLEDIFRFQDQITANIMGALVPRLENAEIERAKRKPTENFDAYDSIYEEWHALMSGPRMRTAKRWACSIRRSRSIAVRFGLRHGRYCYSNEIPILGDEPRGSSPKPALSRRAIELDKDDASRWLAGVWSSTSATLITAQLIDRALLSVRTLP